MQKKLFATIARTVFWLAAVAIVVLALAPLQPPLGILNDKAQHLLGFFGLTVLGVTSWGRRSAISVGLGLAILGGVIEIAQALPLVGRDSELMDWVADIAGILLALLPTILIGSTR